MKLFLRDDLVGFLLEDYGFLCRIIDGNIFSLVFRVVGLEVKKFVIFGYV